MDPTRASKELAAEYLKARAAPAILSLSGSSIPVEQVRVGRPGNG
jgi:hypothetical protein